MHRYRPTFHFLLALLVMFQAATVSGQVYCQHHAQGSPQDTSSSNIPGDLTYHQHHAGMNEMNDQDQFGCACGFDCSGTCMHACQGPSLISHFDPTSPIKHDIQPELISGLAVSGFTTLPLRPPAIS